MIANIKTTVIGCNLSIRQGLGCEYVFRDDIGSLSSYIFCDMVSLVGNCDSMCFEPLNDNSNFLMIYNSTFATSPSLFVWIVTTWMVKWSM